MRAPMPTPSQPRGRGRRRNDMQRLPGGNLPTTGGQTPPVPRTTGRGRAQANGQRGSLGGAVTPGLGRQLTSRVQSGAITQDQAQRTAQQRQTLQKAFGPDWRQKVYGDTGYAQRTRSALSKSPDNAQVAALNKRLMERRKQMLEAARKKNGQGTA